MPVTQKLLAPSKTKKWQILKRDANKRYLVNESKKVQMLFGPNSAFTEGNRIIKIAAEFDNSDSNSVRFIAYLFNVVSGSTDNAATCIFKIYKVVAPFWQETLVNTISGTITGNSYFFADVDLASLSPAELDGDSTLMIEATVTRLAETFKDRIYVNHLGIYDNVDRLRKDVEFLDITKLDE